jgi:hypothetical protein
MAAEEGGGDVGGVGAEFANGLGGHGGVAGFGGNHQLGTVQIALRFKIGIRSHGTVIPGRVCRPGRLYRHLLSSI